MTRARSHFQGQRGGSELAFSLGDRKGRTWEEGEHTGDLALWNHVTSGHSLSSLCLGLLPSTRRQGHIDRGLTYLKGSVVTMSVR